MSEAPDPLEAELSTLRPQPVSPGLRRRVAARLNVPPARRYSWVLVVAGVLAVAGVIFFVVPGRKDPALPPPAVVPPPAPAERDSPAPSVLAYQQALARSPEDLDALLDKQIATVANPNPLAVGTFTRSPATLETLLGDD